VSWGGNGVLEGSVTLYLYSTTIDVSKFVPAGYFCIQNNVFPSPSGVLDFLSCLPALPGAHPTGPIDGFWMGIPLSRGSLPSRRRTPSSGGISTT